MNGTVRGAFGTHTWAFLFPAQAPEDVTHLRGRPFLIWITAGFASSIFGWVVGGLFGSWAPRTAFATAAVALAFGWLVHRPGVALLGAICTAIASLAAVRFSVTPVLAFPVAGLLLGIMGAFAFHRRRAQVTFLLSAPLLAAIGFLAGVLGFGFAAMSLNDSRVSAQIALGGAAGFGLLLMAGAALAARWLDAKPKTGDGK